MLPLKTPSQFFDGRLTLKPTKLQGVTWETISIIELAGSESPAIFPEYLRLSLPCDPQNPHGAAACKKDPFRGK